MVSLAPARRVRRCSEHGGVAVNATLLLAVYTMIGVDQHAMPDAAFWHEPLLLVAGAAGYGLLALAWNAIFVHRPVRQSLAQLYDALGDYLVCNWCCPTGANANCTSCSPRR